MKIFYRLLQPFLLAAREITIYHRHIQNNDEISFTALLRKVPSKRTQRIEI